MCVTEKTAYELRRVLNIAEAIGARGVPGKVVRDEMSRFLTDWDWKRLNAEHLSSTRWTYDSEEDVYKLSTSEPFSYKALVGFLMKEYVEGNSYVPVWEVSSKFDVSLDEIDKALTKAINWERVNGVISRRSSAPNVRREKDTYFILRSYKSGLYPCGESFESSEEARKYAAEKVSDGSWSCESIFIFKGEPEKYKVTKTTKVAVDLEKSEWRKR